jgi:RNA polymerase sigma-54 factor
MQEACRAPLEAACVTGSLMGLSQRLEIRQGQSLVMTPQLLQAIKLLQLSHLDLAAYVDAELERNPLLERAEEEGASETPAAAVADGPDPDGFDGLADGDDAPADNWLTEDRGATRAELEGEHGTSFDNLFQDEPAERPARPGRGCRSSCRARRRARRGSRRGPR